jgi:hypothetical protein
MAVNKIGIPSSPTPTTPGRAQPEKARAAEVLAEKRPDQARAEGAKPQQAATAGKSADKALPANASEARLEADKGLVETLFGNPHSRDGHAMRILYQEALGKLETLLRDELADPDFSFSQLVDKTSGLSGQEDYWSAEKTADRIVAAATAHLHSFQKQHPELALEQQLDQFLAIIGKAIDQGVGEAIEILDGFGVFEGSIKDNALHTQELAHEKLAAFRERMLNPEV